MFTGHIKVLGGPHIAQMWFNPIPVRYFISGHDKTQEKG